MGLISRVTGRMACAGGDHTPNTLDPTPYTLHPTPCTQHPTHYTLTPTPYTGGDRRAALAAIPREHVARAPHPAQLGDPALLRYQEQRESSLNL